MDGQNYNERFKYFFLNSVTDGSQIFMRDTAFWVGGAQRPALRDVERGARTGLRLAMLITRRGPKKNL